jgi:DNA-binding IclR family transcriptional regulator
MNVREVVRLEHAPSTQAKAGAAGDRQFVVALARGLEVLRAFKPQDGLLGNQELAQRTGLPKPTVSRLTHTLTKLGYLTHVGRFGKYQLAPGALALGYAALANLGIREIARPYMQALADEASAAVAIGSRDRLSMIYLAQCRSSAAVTVRLDVGSRIPMATTAMGRAYLAALSEAERGPILESLAPRFGAQWPRVLDGILRAVHDVSRRGFTVSAGEWQPDVYAVGAPLIAADGSGVFAFNCGAPAYGIDDRRLDQELGPRLVDVVRTVEAVLNGGPRLAQDQHRDQHSGGEFNAGHDRAGEVHRAAARSFGRRR